MRRFTGPGWRIAGSTASWLLFAFSFAGLYQAASVVSGLGGFCASGGPYVIETECPSSVVVFAPLGIFGMIIAVGIGLLFARGFGAPLVVWAWPILFIGLGIQFAVSGAQGDVTGIVLAVVFIAMGAVPLVLEVRGGIRRILVGTHNLADARLTDREGARVTVYGGRGEPGETVAVRPLDAVLSLAILVTAVGLGLWLSILAFNGLAAAG